MSEKRKPTQFESDCYKLLKLIPKGKVSTYKLIANALGSNGARAVGNACNKNPYAPEVPCHRVVHSDGRIGGYAYGTDKKADLLAREGITAESGKIKDFQSRLHTFDS